jgi:HSP90 family molecular chaperone
MTTTRLDEHDRHDVGGPAMSEPMVTHLSALSAPENDESAFELEPVRSELEERALALRRDGVSFPAIAREQGTSLSTAFRRVRRAEQREESETSEERRAHAAAQLDRVILRMNAIMTSREAKDTTVIRAAEQLISAVARKARLLGDEAPARQIIKLNYVSEEALAEEREQLEATLTAMGVDLSAFPTPEEIAQRLLATRPAVALPEQVNAGPVAQGWLAL